MTHSTKSCEGQHYWEPHDNPYRWNLISLWKCMTHKQGNELCLSLPHCGLLQWWSHFANIMEKMLWLKLSTMILFSIACWGEHLKYTLLIMEDIVFKGHSFQSSESVESQSENNQYCRKPYCFWSGCGFLEITPYIWGEGYT